MSPSTEPPSDHYLTVTDGPEVETRVKGSRFIAQTLRTHTEQEALERLDAIRKRFHDATHHCWGLRLGPPGGLRERYDDDGEPARTAGPPILSALTKTDLYDALTVVSRWFGGTKLGTGGLTRAYGDAARRAIDAAGRRQIWRETELEVQIEYEDLGAIEAVLGRQAGSIRRIQRSFDPQPHLLVVVARSQAETLAGQLTEATGARARLILRELD